MSEEQALEKAAPKTPAVITTPEEYRGSLLRWQERNYNVLTPFANISGLAAQHGILSTVISVNTDKLVGEVYDGTGGLPFLKDGELALAKNGLRKIAEGLGISTRLEYISVGDKPNYWHVKAIATYRGLDGAIVTREASQEWDLRDATVRTKEFGDRQINQARKNGLRNCETRAINAAIRECGCGIKQKYTKQELARPFLAVRVAFQPDMSDPETRRMITERALGGTNAMYPSPARDLPAAADVVDHVDDAHDSPRHVGRGSTASASAAAPPADTRKVDEPPTKDAVKIADAKQINGETNGRKWTKTVVIDSNGVEYSSFSKTDYADALRFKGDDAWVEIASEKNGNYNNIIEIVKAGSEPSLPGMGEL